jgi:endonuclease/exonuclease/phosphatase family metal-dependent hydrolase
VGVQEANQRTTELLRTLASKVCDGYAVVDDGDPGQDREVVLTSFHVAGSQRFRLAGPLRTALWTRLVTPVGAVDLWTTHLASSSDDRPCDAATCTPPCSTSDTLNSCQGRQVVELANSRATTESVVVVAGDLNARPGEPTIDAITSERFVDTNLAAGNAECTDADRANCTSGRNDTDLTDLTSTANRQTERIDYVFLGATRGCTAEHGSGSFRAAPEEDGPAGLTHPSDHTGVMAVISCPTTAAQRRAGASAGFPSTAPTTSSVESTPDVASTSAITEAYRLLFDGSNPDLEQRLGALEDPELMRPVFMAQFEQTKDIAARISVRIDSVTLTGPDSADVTYSLVLDGSPVLDHLPGGAVRPGGQVWKVTRRTFCDVATQGMAEIPEPCRT